MTERLDALLGAGQRARLPQNERVLWADRTRANFWYRDSMRQVLATLGLTVVWGGFFYAQLIGTWTTFGRVVTRESKIHDLICFSPFFLFWLSMVLYPFWRWVRLSRAVWVVTDAAVYRFCWPCMREWRVSEVRDDIEQIDKANGHSDFYFAKEERSNRNGSYVVHHAIENVPQVEAQTVAYALNKLAERKVARTAKGRRRAGWLSRGGLSGRFADCGEVPA